MSWPLDAIALVHGYSIERDTLWRSPGVSMTAQQQTHGSGVPETASGPNGGRTLFGNPEHRPPRRITPGTGRFT